MVSNLSVLEVIFETKFQGLFFLFSDMLKGGGPWVITKLIYKGAEQLSYGSKTFDKLGSCPNVFKNHTLGELLNKLSLT